MTKTSMDAVCRMTNKTYLSIVISLLWFWPSILSAQTAESKLAALEKVAPQERQQRLYELAKRICEPSGEKPYAS